VGRWPSETFDVLKNSIYVSCMHIEVRHFAYSPLAAVLINMTAVTSLAGRNQARL
jgi:hypothetical protein